MTQEGAAAPPLRFAELLPEPAHLWIRYRPRRWPTPAGWWLDLAAGGLGREATPTGLPPGPAPGVDDVVYLPPVPQALEPARQRLSRELTASGTPVLYQLVDPTARPPAGATPAYDLTPTLLAGDLEPLRQVGGCAVWALIPGVTDRQQLLDEGLERLRDSGARYVVGVVPSLRGSQRRALLDAVAPADGEGVADAVFQSLFHGPAPSPRDFARAVSAAGLSPFFPRPLPEDGGGRAGNRRLAGGLTHAAELWLSLGQAEGPAQAMFRAARKIDRETHDITRLAHEGNLGVVTWLDGDSRQVVEELAVHGSSSLLSSLEEEYLKG